MFKGKKKSPEFCGNCSVELTVFSHGRLIDSENRSMKLGRLQEEGFGWTSYHTVEEIYAWIDSLLQYSQFSSIQFKLQTIMVLREIHAQHIMVGLPYFRNRK